MLFKKTLETSLKQAIAVLDERMRTDRYFDAENGMTRKEVLGMNTPVTTTMMMPVPEKVAMAPITEQEQRADQAIAIAEEVKLPRVAAAIRKEANTGRLRRVVLSMLQEEEIPVYPWVGVQGYLERLKDEAVRQTNLSYIQVEWTRIENYQQAIPLHALELVKRLQSRLEKISPMDSSSPNMMMGGDGSIIATKYSSSGRTTIEREPPKPRPLVHFEISEIRKIKDPFLAIFGTEGDPIVIAHWDEPGYKPFATQ